jgi:2-dehydropantoate 2-reductase
MLAAAGESVLLVLRPETLAVHPPVLTLESPLGNRTAPCRVTSRLAEPVDILWVTTKATQLEAALALVPGNAATAMVVPLLNGIDHVGILRSRFGAERVVPGTIAAELERTQPGHIVHRSPLARFEFLSRGEPGLRAAVEVFTRAGCVCSFEEDEMTLLWRKLSVLAPMALTTTASGKAVGEIRDDPAWGPRLEAVVREVDQVAVAEAARVDLELTLGFLRRAPAGLRSSMQKDVESGRSPELDAIGGPILRAAERHGIPVPVTASLVRVIRERG